MGKAKKGKAGSKAKSGSVSKADSKAKSEESTPSTKESSASQEHSSSSQLTSGSVETSAGDTTTTSKSDRSVDGKANAIWPPPLNRPMLPFLVLPADVEMPSLERQPSPIVTRDCSNVWFFPVAVIALAAIVIGMVFLSRSIQNIDARNNQENATDNGTSSANETSFKVETFSHIENSSDWFRAAGAAVTDQGLVIEETGSKPPDEWSTQTKSPEATAIGRNLRGNGTFTTGPQRASTSLAAKNRPVKKETMATTGSWSKQESPPRPTSSGTVAHHGPLKRDELVTNGPLSTADEQAINRTSA